MYINIYIFIYFKQKVQISNITNIYKCYSIYLLLYFIKITIKKNNNNKIIIIK